MRRIAIVAVAALGLAACSNNGYGGGGSSSSAAPPATGAATVATASVGSLGTVLVDGTGRTLYLFESDTGSTSTCTGGCAATWPALMTDGDPISGDGASASMLGTSASPAGGTQVTYNGHPLYLYSGDSASGQANGEGMGGVWYAVTADGTSAQPGASGTGGGGGYGGGGYGNG